jgi:hypothetical protein
LAKLPENRIVVLTRIDHRFCGFEAIAQAENEAIAIGTQGFAGGLDAVEVAAGQLAEKGTQQARFEMADRPLPLGGLVDERGVGGANQQEPLPGLAGIHFQGSPPVGFPTLLQALEKFYHFHLANGFVIVFANFFAKSNVKMFAPPPAAVEEDQAGGLTGFLLQTFVQGPDQGVGQGEEAIAAPIFQQAEF